MWQTGRTRPPIVPIATPCAWSARAFGCSRPARAYVLFAEQPLPGSGPSKKDKTGKRGRPDISGRPLWDYGLDIVYVAIGRVVWSGKGRVAFRTCVRCRVRQILALRGGLGGLCLLLLCLRLSCVPWCLRLGLGLMEALVGKINAEYGEGTALLELHDQYYNMREKIEPVMHVIDIAFKAMQEAGVKPAVKAIRGGTDGAQLSFKGLPCPNIFAGGLNFHGRFEFVPIQSMEKAMKVVVEIAQLVAER